MARNSVARKESSNQKKAGQKRGRDSVLEETHLLEPIESDSEDTLQELLAIREAIEKIRIAVSKRRYNRRNRTT